MPEDEFRTELSWPTDPLGERPAADDEAAEPTGQQDSPPPPPKPDGHDDAGDRLLERVDTLRRDVDAHLAGLRAELAGIRGSLAELLERPTETSRGSAAPSIEPLLAELAQMRDELVSLRRRITLRADAQADTAVLSDEQLDRIARTVAGLLSGVTDRPQR
jgi:ABC-type transporter Mla subunit MlaD